MCVNSGEFEYNGREIVLVGKVDVQHSLGQILARRLSFFPRGDSLKKNKYGFFKISGDVRIALKDGGELACQEAELDYGEMRGIFLGNEEERDVTFSMDSHPSFELKCGRLNLFLLQEKGSSPSDPSPSPSTRTFVRQIEAEQNVRIRLPPNYLLIADRAHYLRRSPAGGLLTLTAGEKLDLCQLTDLKGGRIAATSIRVDTEEKKLFLERPFGSLIMPEEKGIQKTVEFSSKELLIEGGGKTLRLIGEVCISQDGCLRLETDDELILSKGEVDGKEAIRFLQCKRQARLSYSKASNGADRKIYCPGPLSIDQGRLEVTLQGIPSQGDQEGNNKSQVLIEDVLGEMHADSVFLHYAIDGRPVIRKMVLEGSVSLVNRFDGHPEESGSVLHLGLADRVVYLPESNEMVLSSMEGNRVLFIDSVNHVQMSAPSLTVRHDALSHKNTVQGFGDVRFTFLESEIKELAGRFPMADSPQKEIKDAKSKK